MALQSDSLLRGRYRIVGELGHGGMGAVYRGTDENLGVEVAIKENLFVSPQSELQFRREASLLASLRHPNLPRVTDHFVIPDQGQYLVMDFIPGEDAQALLERRGGPLPERDVVRWGREILGALAYLHGRPQPVLHRDVKPANIKVMPNSRAVLVDFGLAKVHDTSQGTTTGVKAYTPGFAPPEQYGHGRTDPRTDVYALGATLYNLLTGQLPAESLDRAMGQQTLVPIRALNPVISAQTAAAVERALGVKPDDRFPSAAAFLEALPDPETMPVAAEPVTVRRPAETPGAPPAAAVPALAVVPAPRRNIGLLWVIGLLVAALAGGAALVGALALGRASAATASLPLTATALPATDAASPAAGSLSATSTSAPSPLPATVAVLPTETAQPTAAPAATDTPAPTAPPRGGGPGQIAFVSERAGGVPQIFLASVAGPGQDHDLRPLTNLADGACEPAWSPDGQKLLFISPCPGKKIAYPGASLYVMNADGTDPQPLISRIGGVFGADWSASGIAYTYFAGGRPQVWLADAAGGGSVQLSKGTSSDSQASWAPDGQRLAYTNLSRAGRPTLYWMMKDGSFQSNDGFSRSLPEQVTRDQDAQQPDWSPDGNWVAYVSGGHVFVVDWRKRGFDALNLTGGDGPNEAPDWSPDGRFITFETWRQGANHDIWIMTANGGGLEPITTDPAPDYQPAWRP